MAFGGYYQKAEDEQCGPSGKEEPEERKSEGGVGTRAGERARCLFPCISSLDRCLLDDGIKESFNMTSVPGFLLLLLLLDKTHLALALKSGHTVHHTHLVK